MSKWTKKGRTVIHGTLADVFECECGYRSTHKTDHDCKKFKQLKGGKV